MTSTAPNPTPNPTPPGIDSSTMRRAVTAGIVGHFVEWYDYGVYAYVATILAVVFFPSSNPTAALLAVFATFAVAFFARPLGGLYFGSLGDRIGRQRCLAAVVVLMSLSTFAIGILPSHAAVGVLAPILLNSELAPTTALVMSLPGATLPAIAPWESPDNCPRLPSAVSQREQWGVTVRVFVAGGTGAIGRHALPALTAAGHQITAMVRSAGNAKVVREAGATPVEVSIFDRSALADAFRGHDTVVNLASALPSPQRFIMKSAWAECTRIRTEGSAAVVDAALAAGVRRVVQESVAMIYRDGGDQWIDEDWPVDRYPIAAGNHAAESNARRFAQSGREATILRFGLFYGRGAAHSEQILRLARRHIVFQAGRPDSYLSSIHVVDGAAAVAAALHSPAGTFNIVDDDPVTKRQNTTALTEAVGTSRSLAGPGRAALLLGDRTTSMTRSLRVSNRRFRAGCDWAPRYPSVREGYRAMAGRESTHN